MKMKKIRDMVKHNPLGVFLYIIFGVFVFLLMLSLLYYSVNGVYDVTDIRENSIIFDVEGKSEGVNKELFEYVPLSLKVGDRIPLKINKLRTPNKVISDMGRIFFDTKTKIVKKEIFLKEDFDNLEEKEIVLAYKKEGQEVEEKLSVSQTSNTGIETDKGLIRYEDMTVLIYPKSYSKSIFK